MPVRHLPALTLAILLTAARALAAAAGAASAPAAGPAPAPAAATPIPSPPPSAAAGAPAILSGDAVLVTADKLERSDKERLITGEGAVTIHYRELRLVADRAVYHEETKDVIADGNVVLDSGPDRMQGDHLELNLETHVGFMEHAQGFLQTYYFTGQRIEKLGPDHYFLRGGTFTTCEGTLPDWRFSSTSADVTVDEYLHAWNPLLRVKVVPVLYFPYAVFPVKRDRATGLLIPSFALTGTDGFTVRNAFYWAPRDNFDATIGLDYLQHTGWATSGEMRYLLAPRTQGVLEAYYESNTNTEARRWSFSTRNSQELPFGLHGEVEALIQSDREFIATTGSTIEERQSERTTSSFYINRSWSAWDFMLSGRNEQSLLTTTENTVVRFPELTVDRTSTRLFDTDLFLKLAASGVRLMWKDTTSKIETTRLHLAPELTRPISLGSVARIIPTAGYDLTDYSQDLHGEKDFRAVPYYRLALEGPRPYRVWDLGEGARYERVKHLIEPRISYLYTPKEDQSNLPLFDSIDRINPANRLEYSLTNTVYGKTRAPAPAALQPQFTPPALVAALPAEIPPGSTLYPAVASPDPGAMAVASATAAPAGAAAPAAPQYATQELLFVKLSQRYTFDEELEETPGQPFSPIEWEARSHPLSALEVWWRGNYSVYGEGVGYQNLALTWRPVSVATVHAEWRTAKKSNQDFVDLGGTVSLGRVGIEARSRYNLAEDIFVEKRLTVKYTSQCWDVSFGFVDWTDDYQYLFLLSLKGIGTVVKI